jgi:hypothetical protein
LRCRIRVDSEKSGFVGDHGGRKEEREGGLVLRGCVGGKCENESLFAGEGRSMC